MKSTAFGNIVIKKTLIMADIEELFCKVPEKISSNVLHIGNIPTS